MDNLQEQILPETDEQVLENQHAVIEQEQDVPQQEEGGLQGDLGLQTEEHFQSETEEETGAKKSVKSAKKEKSVKKEEKSVLDEFIEPKGDKAHDELSEMANEVSDDFFDHLNRQEVVETLEEVVGEDDIAKVKKQISLLKIRFLQLNKENREERLQSFLANGGNKEDYDYSADELEVRFENAFERYRANKAKYTENLEQIKITNLEKKRALLEDLKLLVESSTDSLKQIYDKFKDIQAIWKEIGPVPQANVTELWQNYHFYVEKFFDKVKINRELRELDFKKNLERKIEICEKTEALLLETSIIRSFNLLQQYHQEWKESGPIEEDKKEELWNRFKTASDKINQNRKDHYEKLDIEQEENYKAKLILCEKIEELTQVEFTSVKQVSKMGDEVAIILETWKSLGAAPKEVQSEIWERFRKSLDAFFTNKKQYMSQRKDEKLNNLNRKLDLCIQAEAIAERTDWVNATKEMIELQREWKGIGAVGRRNSETVWKRFRTACDNFFDARKAFYKGINKLESENLHKKEDLIKQVNEYVLVKSKEENLEALKAFQREWTAIGNVPPADKERVRNAFSSAINKHFDELRTFPDELNKAKYTEYIQGILKDKDALGKERWFVQIKIKDLTDDVKIWENNLGFFANSKNSEELQIQFNKKIEQAKQDIEIFKAKLAIIRENTNR